MLSITQKDLYAQFYKQGWQDTLKIITDDYTTPVEYIALEQENLLFILDGWRNIYKTRLSSGFILDKKTDFVQRGHHSKKNELLFAYPHLLWHNGLKISVIDTNLQEIYVNYTDSLYSAVRSRNCNSTNYLHNTEPYIDVLNFDSVQRKLIASFDFCGIERDTISFSYIPTDSWYNLKKKDLPPSPKSLY